VYYDNVVTEKYLIPKINLKRANYTVDRWFLSYLKRVAEG